MLIVLHTALSVSSYKTPRREQKSEFWAPRAPNSLLFFCAVKPFRFYEDSQAQLFFPWALLPPRCILERPEALLRTHAVNPAHVSTPRHHFLIEWLICWRYRVVSQPAN